MLWTDPLLGHCVSIHTPTPRCATHDWALFAGSSGAQRGVTVRHKLLSLILTCPEERPLRLDHKLVTLGPNRSTAATQVELKAALGHNICFNRKWFCFDLHTWCQRVMARSAGRLLPHFGSRVKRLSQHAGRKERFGGQAARWRRSFGAVYRDLLETPASCKVLG